jgi:hypothetical protein
MLLYFTITIGYEDISEYPIHQLANTTIQASTSQFAYWLAG